MPSGLQQVAEANPITVVVDAMRALWLGAPAGDSVWGAVAWSVALIVDLRAAGGGEVPPHGDAVICSYPHCAGMDRVRASSAWSGQCS